jgi:hypothetical protein
MQSIEDKVINRVYGNGKGYAFSQNDFSDLGTPDAIRKALSRFEQSGTIRRVIRGIYDYPRFSQILNSQLSPDIQQVAFALARKFNWRITPTGDTALNLLGVSTQVPARYVYLCDGTNRSYEIGKTHLAFNKATLKEIGFKYQESDLLVQAIRALGKENMTDVIIDKMSKAIDATKCDRIIRDTKMTTTWIHEMIKQVCRQSING